MSIHFVPNEILEHIFGELCGSDVLEVCRRVCRRWEQAVDGLSDEFWKRICAREHREIYEHAYRKARLSWRELYASLNLWGDVATAQVTIYRIPQDRIKQFRIVSDGVIACSYRSRDGGDNDREAEVNDSIVYFDLETMEERRREHFDLDFLRFEENEYFIVLLTLKRENNRNKIYTHVVLKRNRKHFVYGHDTCEIWSWLIHGSDIYLKCFCSNHKHLLRAKLIEKDDGFTLETDDLSYTGDDFLIQGITKIKNKQINILTTKGRIYSLIDKELKLLCQINLRNDYEFQQAITNHGFDWQNLNIFGCSSFETLPLYAPYRSYNYGKTILLHHSRKFPPSIDIYFMLYDNPFYDNGKLEYYKTNPTISIDLQEYISFTEDEIREIGVVEAQNGHMVVVATLRAGLFVIGLSNDQSRRTAVSVDWRESYEPMFFKILQYNLIQNYRSTRY